MVQVALRDAEDALAVDLGKQAQVVTHLVREETRQQDLARRFLVRADLLRGLSRGAS